MCAANRGMGTAGSGEQTDNLPNRSLGAKIALHVGVYYGSTVTKIISDAGSAGGLNSTTAVLGLLDHSAVTVTNAEWVAAAAERPANVKAICQWLLVRGLAAACVYHDVNMECCCSYSTIPPRPLH